MQFMVRNTRITYFTSARLVLREPRCINMFLISGPPILRGRLLSRSLPDAASAGPALLRRTDARTPTTVTPMAGLAWVSVDALCGVHYEV